MINKSNPAQMATCVGRDDLITEIVNSAKKHGAVLLFGGRQSGKTTVLRRLAEVYSTQRGDVAILTSLDVPVFVDLMRLPIDASPATFFSFLSIAAIAQCGNQIDGFSLSHVENEDLPCDPLTKFVADLNSLNQHCGEVDIHLIFLLDEAKRILTDRFPRGFQDNLFALMFGEQELRPVRISFVFAGSQHLYKLSEDDTSPIGSRAAAVSIKNLHLDDVSLYSNKILNSSTIPEGYPLLVFQQAGGHAGLTKRLVEELSDCSTGACDLETVIDNVLSRNRGLLDNWIGSFTPEGLCIANILGNVEKMGLGDVAQCLHNAKLNRFAASRVVDELCYTGIAIFQEKQLYPVNHIFWSYFQLSLQSSNNDSNAHVTWHLIEETELLLREIIWRKFNDSFGDRSLTIMQKILGNQAWLKILDTQKKSGTQYKFTKHQDNRDLMSCMYIGDLQALILSNLSWGNFNAYFRDKRELEDIIKAIAPVRNDRAHFSIVPEKELERCRIACDDLIVLFERKAETDPDV